jgi:CheY-like chemotaxis protein
VLVAAMERALPKPAKAPAAAPAAPLSTAPAAAGAPPPVVAPAAPAALDSILVVDDEAPVCELLHRFLSLRGYRVRAVNDGPQALAAVEQEVPQLIVLDMNMPGMNGVEVLRKLRERKYAGGVILLTTGQDDKLLEEALDLGSVDVMGKPVDLERLALAIQVGCILMEQQRG